MSCLTVPVGWCGAAAGAGRAPNGAAAAARLPPAPCRRAFQAAGRGPHASRPQQHRIWRQRAAASEQRGGGLSSEEQDRLCEKLAAFLREDLPHLFDDQGIDASRYDDAVVFEDPITYYTNIKGYLFNIAFLKRVFQPNFVLHDVRRTGPLELTTRWTMDMSLAVGPQGSPLRRLWDPRLTFTGTSIMGINPATGKFNRHTDTWDAVQQQGYFSLEAFVHMLSQVADLRRGPGAAGGEYAVLKKRRSYEVRSYPGPPAGAVWGGASCSGKGSAAAHVSGTGGGPAVFAVGSFGGEAGPRQAEAAVQQLRQALAADGLQPASGDWLLLAATADDAGSPLLRRNEVLIQLQGFQLW
ncbi:hypothetical protein COHA_001642 [Chlorella ohadii]|uniref:SOUL heme-binding protein n=1 Tax=Chlorella ohadii TaxID=2649997 RepID=A0AAD5H8M9_9CHLO|nr:hypothetical protein COHA_001642 [Chlorella ohadii]